MKNQNYGINKEFVIHKNVIKRLTKQLASTLYKKLINKRRELSYKPLICKNNFSGLKRERGGDQADQVNQMREEIHYTVRLKRDSRLLNMVIKALERMENGRYGICNETQEVINEKRLLSLPWTTLSIEGAEIEESNHTIGYSLHH